MNRVLRCLRALNTGAKDVRTLAPELGADEQQTRTVLANLQNRLMAKPVGGTRPKQYELTEYGREHLATGVLKHPWNTLRPPTMPRQVETTR